MKMFEPDETGLQYFRRKYFPTVSLGETEGLINISYQEPLEIQVESKDISESVLSLSFHYLSNHKDARLIHASIGNKFSTSLSQSKLNISGTSIGQTYEDNRILTGAVYNINELNELFQDISKLKPCYPRLLILESLTPLLYAEKTYQNTIMSSSRIHNMFQSMKSLLLSQHIIIVWITSVNKKGIHQLRETRYRDEISLLWRQYIPKATHWKQPLSSLPTPHPSTTTTTMTTCIS